MNTVESMLLEERKQLKRIVEETHKRLMQAPTGHLRIKKKRGGVEYYYREEEKLETGEKKRNAGTNGRYLKKREAELAKKIAQRDYDMRIVRSASMRMKAIDAFLDCYGATRLGEIYETTNPGRRELLSAKIVSDEEYKRQWQEVEFKGKAFEDGQKVILTERGERVRSKSEKIIADKLYSMGVPYRYECPLWLDGNVRFYPDFTVLRMPAREEVYFEHFGMMDDIGYVEGMTYKLSTYEKNGIYLGVNLFVTYETEKTALNSKVLDGLIRNVFL